MAISGGKVTSKSGGDFSALMSRLSAGKGKIAPAAAKSRSVKTSWNKTGRKTFAVPGHK